ncbi:MAG: hypothetical protein P1U40_05900 [Coxiellaceae bacterium]|nr:hypothetical protein [Coxiellaceae bacterium]
MSRDAINERKNHSRLLNKVLQLLATAEEIHDSYYYRRPPEGICKILAESAKHPLPDTYPTTCDDTAELDAEIQIVADHLCKTAADRIKESETVWFRDPKTHAFYIAVTKEILIEDEAESSSESRTMRP